MFKFARSKREYENLYSVEVCNISKHFKIPHEKRNTVYENITGILKGKTYGYEDFTVLHDVSFTVGYGEALGIIGENGCGKSTLLKIIAGVLSPDEGSVKVGGKIAPFLELGVGFQPELSAEENVYLYGSIMGMNISKMNEKIYGIFEFAELEKFRNVKLKNFSSGMYARLAFATAIASDPDIFLIDEALSVGDEAFQRKCVARIEKFQQSGKTIIFVSHSADLVKKICGKCLLIEKGCVVDYGYSDSVIDKYHARISNRLKVNETKYRDNVEQKEVFERFGSMYAEIEKLEILDEKYIPTNTAKEGDYLIIRLHVKFNTDFNNPVFGIRILNDGGVNVYNTLTKWQNIESGHFKKGDCTIIDFKQKMNLLSGTYFIDCGIIDDDLIEYADAQFNAASFDVEASKEAIGIVDLKSNISIQELISDGEN